MDKRVQDEALNERVQHSDVQQSAERRMWFDYLLKLNDRELQRRQASGATTWVLLALLGGLIYRAALSLPAVSRMPSGFVTMVFLLTLELNAAAWFSMVILFAALPAFNGSTTARLHSELARRILTVQTVAVWCGVILGSTIQCWLFFRLRVPAIVAVPCSLVILFWGLNLYQFIKTKINRSRECKKSALPLPDFSVATVSASFGHFWKIGVLLVPLAALSWFALGRYCVLLSLLGRDWMLLLGGATHFFMIVAIIGILFHRFVDSSRANWHLSLEQRLVVEDLTPSQLREQFIAYSLGISVGDWVQTIEGAEQKALSEYKVTTEKVEAEIEATRALTEDERKSRRVKAEISLIETRERVVNLLEGNKAQWNAFCEMVRLGCDVALAQQVTAFLTERSRVCSELIARSAHLLEQLRQAEAAKKDSCVLRSPQ